MGPAAVRPSEVCPALLVPELDSRDVVPPQGGLALHHVLAEWHAGLCIENTNVLICYKTRC
jgi:hypothetical protein